MTEQSTRVCIRGCVQARRHVTDCEDRDTCKGCMPRPAEYGQLCYPCHTRLASTLREVPGQILLLAAVSGREPGSMSLAQETIAKISNGWRTDCGQQFQGPYARHVTLSASESEPVRLACIDSMSELQAILSDIVTRIVDDYVMTGPGRLLSMDAREDPRRQRWHEVQRAEDGWSEPASRFDPVLSFADDRDEMRGQYIWSDPDPLYGVVAAARFLVTHIERLEWYDCVGDDFETIGQAMAQAHSLAPWREEVARLNGITCPECHARSLVRYGGDENVTCTRCSASMPPARYVIWIRMLADEARAKETA